MEPATDDNRPTELNVRHAGPGLEVDKEKLVITYTAQGRPHDVASIQANKPAPLDSRVFYFEVAILDAGENARIGIGWSDQNFQTSKQPG
jgi:hypothetical protein